MKLFNWVEKGGKKFKWYDFAFLKWSTLFATLTLMSWPAFRDLVLQVPWYIYLVLTIVLMIPLWKKMFSK